MQRKISLSSFLIPLWLLLSAAASAEDKKALETFNLAVKAVNSLKDCEVRYRDDDTVGPNQSLHAHFVYDGKYINHPRIYYQNAVECAFNYPEQTTPGFQEIYREQGDMIYILPPAYRALGVISIYPEDPKSYGPRGENTKSSGPWDFVNVIAEMARNGKVTMEEAKLGARAVLRFEVIQNPNSWYRAGINRVRLFVDPKTYLPIRIERFDPSWPQPVVVTEYETFQANTGLTPDQMKFEGLKNPFSMIRTPEAAEIDPFVTTSPRTRLSNPAPDPQEMLAAFNRATDKLQDYRTDLTMGFRYGRLRLYREDRFAYSRNPYWFTLFTTVQKANFLLLSHSAGSALWYSPEDKSLHLRGGGVQKVMGEQTFAGNDYKFYDQVGDNPYQLNFPDLKKWITESFANNKAKSRMVDLGAKKMWELQLVRTTETPPGQPGKINLVLDPQTGLPAALELSGYDDPRAFIAYTFSNTKTNLGLKPAEIKF